MQNGADDTRDAVRPLRDTEMQAVSGGHTAMEHYGCLGARDINKVTDRHTAQCRRRLDALL